MNDDWNDGYWTEGLDRLHSLVCIASMMLGHDGGYHPSVTRAGLEKDVDKLVSDINHLYQKMGRSIPEE